MQLFPAVTRDDRETPATDAPGLPFGRDCPYTFFPMRFFAYILGFLILIAGLAWGAIEAGAPTLYVQIGSVILLGLGIILGASRTRPYRNTPDVTVVRDNDPL